MEHYICTGGCKGSAKEPGVCQSEECLNYGQPMEECDCTDGKHYMGEEEHSSSSTSDDEDSMM